MERQLWQLLEPIHAVVYYAPEVFAEFAALGYPIDTRWPSYFALRSAPLGTPSAELVAAAFYSFNPDMVAAHVPTFADRQDILDARRAGVDKALRRLLGDAIGSPDLAEAAALAKTVAKAANTAGRPLAAANAALPWPQEPHLVLWHAATVIREHRGDGHVAALLTAGLDGCEALVSFAAVGAAPVPVFSSRAWTDEQWAAAQNRLVERGWLNPDGTATALGRAERDEIERVTDALAAAPWRAIGPAAGRLAQLAGPMTMTVAQSGLLPQESTLGIRR